MILNSPVLETDPGKFCFQAYIPNKDRTSKSLKQLTARIIDFGKHKGKTYLTVARDQ